ncbi:MAG TPA: tripartite tricarboxylate transporter substrate-binding protein [Alphaproteobacteria bacterium]|nr:tripartite tricarboxylate transporter substrate-binding protein [Alphaproteobacteria bacterium]
MRLVAALALSLTLAGAAVAQPAADFYRGKTVRVLIGVGVGGDYDVQGRFLARHIGRHIPGTPSVVAENMTGAGGLKMTNWLYEVAPKDGTVFGIIANNFPALQAAGGAGVQFEAAKFQWLGAMTRETNTMVVWHTAGVKTVEDVRRIEVAAGASGRGAITYTFPAMMNELLGTKFRIVTGYAGGNEINLAMERGEVAARINSWSSWKATRPDWVRDGKIVIIAQGGRRSPELPNVPSVEELARNDADRQVIEMLMSGASLGRPFAAPPGVPADRIAALRAAFAAMVEDPTVKAEAAATKLELDPLSGEQMQAMIEKLLATSPDVAARAKNFLQ